MSANIVYLDSSALVKIVTREAESEELLYFLSTRPARASCALARVEVVRAVRGLGMEAVERARRAIARLSLLPLDEQLLHDAAHLDPVILSSLGAIHLAAARTLSAGLEYVVTYDTRMSQAAKSLGLPVSSPGR